MDARHPLALGATIALLLACGESRPPGTPLSGVPRPTTSPPVLPDGFVALAAQSVDLDARARLCGVIATGSRALTALPAQSAGAAPDERLVQRILETPMVTGVRYVVPGASGGYVFEGLTRDGTWYVRGRRAVTTRPGIRVPVGAPDATIEAALMPSPESLDAVVQRLPLAAGRPETVTAHADRPVAARAVTVVADLARFEARLTDACPEATLRLPMLARIDQRIRIPVQTGDEISAFASTPYGVVRIGFDEVGTLPAPDRFTDVPRARVAAGADGVVTLRVQVAVVPRQQRAEQEVLVHLVRRRPAP